MRVLSRLPVLVFFALGVARAETPAPAPDLLEEIQEHFHPAKKWFGMVSELTWDRAANGSLTPRYETIHSSFVLPQDPAGQVLRARLPADSTGPLEVWLDGAETLSVRTEELGIVSAPAELIRGVVVYRGAVAGGDLLYKLTPTHVDEYVYFRKPPPQLRREFEFDHGGGVAKLRQAGRLIEVVGKDGAAHLRLSAPVARAADGTRRTGTVRLEGTRLIEELDLRGLPAPILVDPDWTTTGTMTVAHWADFGWRLDDGTVMAVGGCALASCPLGLATSSCNQVLASTDVWNSNKGTWTSGPPLMTSRYSYAAVPLPSGELLVAGGCTSSGCASTTALAERYSKAQQAWVPAGALPSKRANTQAVLLAGGDALVAGGCDETQCLTDVARYQSAANQWVPVAALPSPRGYATTTALADGTVLVLGGCADLSCATVLADAVRYDPVSDTWRAAGTMGSARAGHTATLLDDGKVLVAGGCSSQPCKQGTLATTELWELGPPGTGGRFTPGPTMNAPRHHHTATRLPNGQFLIAGGADGIDVTRAAAEVYLPLGRRFLQVPRMLMSRAYHVAVGLSSGQVLVGGGCNPATCLPWAEVFNPAGLPVEAADGGAIDAGPWPDPDPDPQPDLTPFTPTGGPHPKLFRSGVVTCSTDDVQELPCPVAGWRAEDAEFQPNTRPMVPQPNDEVLDEITGLVWKATGDGNNYTQADAVSACEALSTPAAAAGTWRLPSVLELMTINHYGKLGPSVDQAFGGTQPTNYWTSTPVAGSKLLGWTVKFDAGEVVPVLKDSPLPIRCVRAAFKRADPGGGHLRLAGPLTITPNTVRDEANILEWQRHDDGIKRTWRDSLDVCAHLNLDGHRDWHLPNTFELLSLVEFGSPDPVKLDSAFLEPKGDLYWTSTQGEGLPTLSWGITFNLGVIDGVTYSGRAYARCVRHIQPAAASCHCGAGQGGAALWLAAALALLGLRARRKSA